MAEKLWWLIHKHRLGSMTTWQMATGLLLQDYDGWPTTSIHHHQIVNHLWFLCNIIWQVDFCGSMILRPQWSYGSMKLEQRRSSFLKWWVRALKQPSVQKVCSKKKSMCLETAFKRYDPGDQNISIHIQVWALQQPLKGMTQLPIPNWNPGSPTTHMGELI